MPPAQGWRDLVAALRTLDAELAAAPPDPRLRTRIRASIEARGRSRWWPPGGEAARIGLPIGLAAATAAVIVLAGRPQPHDEPVAGGEPRAVAKETVDAGPMEPSSPRVVPSIHAPGLREPVGPAIPAPAPEPRRPPPDRRSPAEVDAVPPEQAPAPRPGPGAPRTAPTSASVEGTGAPGSTTRPPLFGAPAMIAGPGHAFTMGDAPRSPLAPVMMGDGPRPMAQAAGPASSPVPAVSYVPPAAADVPPLLHSELKACLSPDTLKLEADATCQAEGMVPSTYDFLDPCGDGRYRGVDPKCVPPPDTSDACTSGVAGDGATCTDLGLLEKAAQEACLDGGLALADVFPDPAGCAAGQARLAKYACCSAPKPEPPAPATGCFPMELDVAACATHDALTAGALASCAAKGGVVTDLAYAHECPGGALTAAYTCCAP